MNFYLSSSRSRSEEHYLRKFALAVLLIIILITSILIAVEDVAQYTEDDLLNVVLFNTVWQFFKITLTVFLISGTVLGIHNLYEDRK
jgi:hypothetical protein